MSKKRFIFQMAAFFCLVLYLLSCNSQKSKEPGTVTIDLSQLPAKQVDVSKYIDDVFVVPLETTPGSLLGQLSNIDQDDSDIFYVSRENQTIYHFSAGGKFINSFCRLGKGPGEYLMIRNMQILKGKKSLLISDPRQMKLIQYSYTGEMIREMELPGNAGRFAVLKDGHIAVHCGRMINIFKIDTIKNEMVVIDWDGNIVSRHFPFDTPLYFEFSSAFMAPNADGSYLYSRQLDFNIYRIKDSGPPELFLKLDYGAAMSSPKDLEGPTMENLANFRKAGKIWAIDQATNSFQHLALVNHKDRKSSLLLIDKESRNLMAFGTDSLLSLGNYFGMPIKAPFHSYKTHFFSLMEAIDVRQVLQSLTADQKRTLAIKVKGFDRILDIEENDNPVLVYFSFRDF